MTSMLKFDPQQPGAIEELLAHRLEELPTVLVRAAQSDTLTQSIEILARTHRIPTEGASLLGNEIMLVLLAFEPYQDLATNLARALRISETIANPIAHDVLQILLTPEIKAALDSIQTERTPTVLQGTDPSKPVQWQHIVSGSTAPPQSTLTPIHQPPTPKTPPPPSTPTPPVVPQYQKPLTGAPRYGDDQR